MEQLATDTENHEAPLTAPDQEPDTRLRGASATYSPEDNKLRLYTVSRLDSETYARVKDAGFKWAPKQELFVTPMWTPERAALLVELCGEIGDEDSTLVERAEVRASRFEEYSENRARDAQAAHAAVAALADNIPLGQPILVGHHSEKRARKDAEKIRNGMRRAVDMWETSEYWTARAKGAIRSAKYKERPDVRHRRIKGLESDKRKQLKEIEESERFSKLWGKPDLTDREAQEIANYDRGLAYGMWSDLESGKIHAPEAASKALAQHAKRIAYARAWLAHTENRISYERAMLDEQGGNVAARFPFEIGGRIQSNHWRARGKAWIVITKLNKDATGQIGSVSTTEGVIEIESITGYQAPEAGAVEKVKQSKKLAPLCNYPGEGFLHMTQQEYTSRAKFSDSYFVRPIKANEKHGAHRHRHGWMPGGSFQMVGVFLTDAKRTDPPAPSETPIVADRDLSLDPIPVPAERRERVETRNPELEAMKQALKSGVTVVASPELFPTPPDLARRMVEIAGVGPGMRALEPSAGTGNIVKELAKAGASVCAVEINPTLAEALRTQYPYIRDDGQTIDVRAGNFMTIDADGLGRFDAVVMNPPFSAEQKHVSRAYELLAEGGILVSVMSAGIRFRENAREFRAFVALHGEIEPLPDDSFKSSGTSVRTVLVTLRKGDS